MGRCVRRGGCWRRCQEAQGPRQRTQLSPWTRPGPGCQACSASWRRPAPPSASSDGQTSSVLSTALPPSCCTYPHTIVQIPISSWFLFSIFTFALDLCWYLCHHRFETPSSVRQVLGNHWCCSKAQKQMLLMPSPELLGGESEIYLKVWGTRLFQRKNPKQQILQIRDPGEHLTLADGEVANGGCDTWLKEKVQRAYVTPGKGKGCIWEISLGLLHSCGKNHNWN